METEISTHALTEGDRKDMFCSSVCMNFNSRPHGGRPVAHEVIAGQWGFQLTPSRRATRLLATIPTPGTFQLTPSRRATSREKQYMDSILFQLTPSRRATATYIVILYLAYFNSRPHGGRRCLRVVLRLLAYFNSRPHGGRPSRDSSFSALLKFQLTPSRRATSVRNDR